MSAYKLKKTAFGVKPRVNAQQLQDEIDNLAVLLNEVKKQIEKIEAAADAIGDAVLFDMEGKLNSGRNRMGSSTPAEGASRRDQSLAYLGPNTARPPGA